MYNESIMDMTIKTRTLQWLSDIERRMEKRALNKSNEQKSRKSFRETVPADKIY